MPANRYTPALEGFGNLAAALVTGPQQRRRNDLEEDERRLRARDHELSIANAMQLRQDRQSELDQRKGEREQDRGTRASEHAEEMALREKELGLRTGKATKPEPIPGYVLSDIERRAQQAALARGLMMTDPESKQLIPRTARAADPGTGVTARDAADPEEIDRIRRTLFTEAGYHPKNYLPLSGDNRWEEIIRGTPEMLARPEGDAPPIHDQNLTNLPGPSSSRGDDRRPLPADRSDLNDLQQVVTTGEAPVRAPAAKAPPALVPGFGGMSISAGMPGGVMTPAPTTAKPKDLASALQSLPPADLGAWKRILATGDRARIEAARKRILAGAR